MSSENIRTVRDYFDAVANGDLAKLPELLSETLVWHQPGSSDISGIYSGRDAVFGLIGNILSSNDFVAMTLHFSGKTQDRSMSMAGIDVLRIENGKIQEVWLFSEDQAAEDAFWNAD